MTKGASARRLLTGVVGVTVGVLAVVAVLHPSGPVTTYAAASPAATVAFLTAGLGLTAAGCIAATDRSTGSLWALGILGGITWLSPAVVGWVTGPPVVRSIGMVAAPFLPPVLLHLLLAAPSGRLNGPIRRIIVTAGYAITAMGSAGVAVTKDPFLDPQCWTNCTDNAFLLVADPGIARVAETVLLGSVVAIGIVALSGAAWQLAAATPFARAAGSATVVPAALAAAAEAAYAVARLADPAENPERSPFATIFLARAGALTALAVGVGWLVIRRQRRRAALVRLVNDLEASSGMGSLQESLSKSSGDSSLTIAYWLPQAGRYVDLSGRPVHLDAAPDRARTSISRAGAPVAVISHDRAVLDDQMLRQRIGPAALLSLDNERLGVELLTHLNDLRASRMRVITAADETRRRIERDLHDGAQQRLLAVLYELRLARNDSSGDDTRAAALDLMIRDTQQALAELRELAQGIFPAILDESGLEPALWTLADQAAIPVEIEAVPQQRPRAALERTAYLIVAETIAEFPPGARNLSVRIEQNGNTLVVELTAPDIQPTEHVADRVGAAGGVLTHHTGSVRAEIPCG